ncbi:MAG: nitroreductase family protein [Bacteroidota bacterium]
MNTDTTIKNRKTQKVLAEAPFSTDLAEDKLRALVDELLDLAAHAPYHYPVHRQYIAEKELNSTMPFRFYVLGPEKCRATSAYATEAQIEAGKLKLMLDAADALFIVTWLPEPSEVNRDGIKRQATYIGNAQNMEHIAATGAAIQNVLIGATARNLPNYWSSGGQLRGPELREYLGIPADEIIAGTVFIFPEDAAQRGARIIPGGMRQLGKERDTWSRWID